MSDPSAPSDREMIAAVIEGDPEQLAEVRRAMGGAAALSSRKTELGLTTQLIKLSRLSETCPVPRKCLKCDQKFLSLGSHNRLCGRCGGG